MPTITLVWRTVRACSCYVSHVRACAHILRKSLQQYHVSISKGGTLRVLGRVLTSEAATVDPPALSPSSSPLPNFRLVLPVQHMTLSLCCLTKHWPRLPTHSHAGWTNQIKAVHRRKVALGVKTGKSCSRRDTVCQPCCSFYHKEIWQGSNWDRWRGWGGSCENKRQTLSDKVSVALSFFGSWPLPSGEGSRECVTFSCSVFLSNE